ncbi:thioredoxin-dependent thiol peroxidase [Hugenholtzia roseola]|uniref:thioredoxin-dependent thiol peroxidase n=1 Tax=Hugenholtzia roseola TaxID=1002 RepID=UPI00040808D4|nr:thioredoxin-dependent thiol peroxidase [Hugenholtzia roseola]
MPAITSLTAQTPAPDFEGKDQNGNLIKLADYKGKKVVLYFYPKDDTSGCTAQACDLRDNFEAFVEAGYQIIGVSPDDEKSHQKFIQKYNLPFPLIADTDKTIHNLYDVWHEKSMYGRKYMGTARTTFVIDEKGVIEEVITKVNTKAHAAQILPKTKS